MKFKGPAFPSYQNQATPAPRRQWIAHCGARARARGRRQLVKKENEMQTVPIVGQPFTLKTIGCPVNATLSCNCGGAMTDVTIVASVAAACPSCQKVFNIGFNPTTNKLEVLVGLPPVQQVPS
jgi:hypothetical protein